MRHSIHASRTTRNSHPILFTILTLALLTATVLLANEQPASFDASARSLAAPAMVTMDGVDNDVLLAVHAEVDRNTRRRPEGAWRFAEPLDSYLTTSNSGSWETLSDGSRLWRLRIASPGATSLNLGLSQFDVPAGARLWLYDQRGGTVQGPYDRSQRTEQGGLWTAAVPAAQVTVELHLPAGAGRAELVIHRVNHGFRPLGGASTGDQEPATKQGNCQNDVVCAKANPWRNQIRSVAWYTLEGVGTCTGQLVNNTAADGKPYFLSAEHCGVTRQNAASMVVYWNYESPQCGQLSGGRRTDNQTGATFRAAHGPSDFVLVELKQKPKAKFNTYYAGWNAVNKAPVRAVGIHHPNLDEKSISFSNRQLRPDESTHWEIVWDDGTTEPGSSGSCIFDKDGYCVGTLTGGLSFCSDPQAPDYYGRFSRHWTGGGSKATSLKPWLDSGNTGRMKMQGRAANGGGGGEGGGGEGGGGEGGGGQGGGGQSCKATAHTMCLGNKRFAISATWKDFDGKTGQAKSIRTLGNSGTFFFFEKENWEMLVKVLDGCAVNQRFWVSTAATTNLEYTIKVRDMKSGKVKTYKNTLGQLARSVLDTGAFASCP